MAFEGVVDPVGDQFPQLRDGVALRGVVAVGRAELQGQLGLLGSHVDCDDALRTGESPPLDDVEAHAAAPDHRDGGTGLDRGRVEHRTDAGGHGAPDDGDDIERGVVAHLHGSGRGTTTSSANEETPR